MSLIAGAALRDRRRRSGACATAPRSGAGCRGAAGRSAAPAASRRAPRCSRICRPPVRCSAPSRARASAATPAAYGWCARRCRSPGRSSRCWFCSISACSVGSSAARALADQRSARGEPASPSGSGLGAGRGRLPIESLVHRGTGCAMTIASPRWTQPHEGNKPRPVVGIGRGESVTSPTRKAPAPRGRRGKSIRSQDD